MGAVQSFLSNDTDTATANTGVNNNAANSRHRASVDQHGLSWVSSKMQRDMAAKFSELELLSLRQVLQQLKDRQDEKEGQDRNASLQRETLQPQNQEATTKKDSRSLVGITEETFVVNSPDSRPDQDQPLDLTVRDMIKPLALYCHKVNEDILVDDKPLKAIFESFAERSSTLSTTSPAAPGTPETENDTTAATISTELSSSPDGCLPLQRSKTIEDSLKDLTLQTNFEWNPEDEDAVEAGPRVKALDLVEILDGLFWLIQEVFKAREADRNNEDGILDTAKVSGARTTTIESHRHRHRALMMVENLVQYGKTSSRVLPHSQPPPIDLATEMIDFATFSKYVSRNTPNLFEIVAQYFYSLFLIGNTLRPTQATAGCGLKLPGVSPVPELDAASTIITPETLAMISWFLPLTKTTPTMTKLYAGSLHGFSMNQFEVHVCKYPASTLLLLLVERQRTATPTVNRRSSISFASASSRHQRSMSSSHSPSYTVPWGVNNQKPSVERLTGRSPMAMASTGGALSTIHDGMASTSTALTTTTNNNNATDGHATSIENIPATIASGASKKERLVLGAYVTETWKVSKSGWGNDTFAVLELSPCFEVFPAKKTPSSAAPGSKPSPPPSRSLPIRTLGSQQSAEGARTQQATNRHFVHFLKNAGIGFGGQESDSCILFMDDNLQYGSYKQDYAGGNVYMGAGGARQSGFEIDFEVVECEVWGLGGQDAKARQQKEWDFEQREANRRASIHLRKDGEQEIDRDLLEMAGVLDPDRGHRHARRQSAVS
ncbi:Restriction of telomere capping protein 5 [Mortierella claussenii]|nr:Restriction of telomere capping protein 5 [Mortierella claussenii]